MRASLNLSARVAKSPIYYDYTRHAVFPKYMIPQNTLCIILTASDRDPSAATEFFSPFRPGTGSLILLGFAEIIENYYTKIL